MTEANRRWRGVHSLACEWSRGSISFVCLFVVAYFVPNDFMYQRTVLFSNAINFMKCNEMTLSYRDLLLYLFDDIRKSFSGQKLACPKVTLTDAHDQTRFIFDLMFLNFNVNVFKL